MKSVINKIGLFICLIAFLMVGCKPNNTDPLKTEIITSDLNNFWKALEMAGPEVDPKVLDEMYLRPGSLGVEGFMDDRIESAENLSKVIKSNQDYYHSIRTTTDSIVGMKGQIIQNFVKFKDLYPEAAFPPIYFVIGALNSGGTTSKDGLIIGAEMFGLPPLTVKDVPHLVTHELIHVNQDYRFWHRGLLPASIKEGAADFLAELISGKHINRHVHDFANPREKELWLEFKGRINNDDYYDWFYNPTKGRPSDLGYWMGYKITKAYYDKAQDKKMAIHDILNIKDFDDFLNESGYAAKFN